MSTFNEDIAQLKQSCRDIRDDTLDVYPPRAVVILAAVIGVAFVVGWIWVMRGMVW